MDACVAFPEGPCGSGKAAVHAAHGKGHWVRSGEERAADGLQSLYALEAEIEAAKHDTGSAAAPAQRPARNGLLQIPARFGTRHRAQIEALGLYDTGASKSFIDAGYVKRHGLKVHVPSHRLLRVMNGDGSFQEAQGEVTLFMHVGARFVERVTFVVIDLDKFDFIMGLPEIEGFRMELKGEPMRIHIYGSAQRKGGPPKTVAPAVIHSGVGADGKPEVFVLDFNARELMQWHERGTADVFCLYEDPFSERDALISDPQEEIEWRAYLLHLQDQAVAAGLDGAALREAEAARAAAELEFKVGERAGEGHGKDPEYSEDQVALARKHPGVFSDELPPEPSARFPDGTEFARLRLKHGEVPRSRKQYRIPEALRPQLQKTIEELLQHGLIEPQAGSPYNSPILFAPKPNSPTGEMRFCFDARELNKVLEDHPYPNPTTEEMFDRVARLQHDARLAGVEQQLWFSKSDARHGYWQIRVHPDDRDYLAFTVPVLHGSYRWTVLAMGCKSSAAIFQRAMDQVLAPFSSSNTFRVRQGGYEGPTASPTGPGFNGAATADQADKGKYKVKEGIAFGTAFSYVDDCLIVSVGSREEHVALVDAVFQAFQKHQFIFKLSKTELYKQEMDFLGHRLTQSGVARQAAKVEAIQKWELPKTQEELRSFLSVLGYYRRFVDGFAKLAQPLSDMLREGEFQLPFSPAAAEAFYELRRRMASAPILKYFDPRHETELWTDASAKAIGGAVLQRDERGNLRPVAYYSRRLSPSEENYSTYQRELLGIRDCLLAFRFYLIGMHFVVKTDHSSLRWLTEQPEMSSLQARWYTVFQDYHIKEIQYVKGERNALADALSRYPDANEQPLDHLVPPFNMDLASFLHLSGEEGEQPASPATLPTPTSLFPASACVVQPSAPTNRPMYQSRSQTPWQGTPTMEAATVEDWQALGFNVSIITPTLTQSFGDHYAACPDFGMIWARLSEGRSSDVYPEYLRDDARRLLFFRAEEGGMETLRICVPTVARAQVLREMHDSASGGHFGVDRTFLRTAHDFLWPRMRQDVVQYVASCQACQCGKTYTARSSGIPTPVERPDGRWQVVSLDIVSVAEAEDGHDAVVVFTDLFSKQIYCCPIALKGTTAEHVAELFLTHVYRTQGMPKVLLSDKDSKFISLFWERLFQLLGTKLKYSASYHHQSNGQVERVNKTLVEALRTFVSDTRGGIHPKEWPRRLVMFEFAYNSSAHATTGYAPFELLYGEVPRTPASLEAARPPRGPRATEMAEGIMAAQRAAADALAYAGRKYRERHAQARRGHVYKVGDMVLLSTDHLSLRGESPKLFPRYTGPFRVRALRGVNNVELAIPKGTRFCLIDPVVNVERVRPYYERKRGAMTATLEDGGPVAILEDPRGGSWWEVEDVVATRPARNGARRFLVRYKGFGPAFDEWKEEADVSEVLVQAYDELCRRASGEGGEVAKGAGMPRRQQTTAARGAEMPPDAQASGRGTRRSARLRAPRK